MDAVYEELDEAKAEIEKLRMEYWQKLEVSETLKKAHSDQLIKIQEANSKLEKQAQELNEKTDEISIAKQMNEDLKSNLKEKEAIIKHLSSANNKLRIDCDLKLQKHEEEKRELVSSLEEANDKNTDQEQQICELKNEIECLKGLLSVSQKKCSEVEKNVKVSKEMRQRDDMLLQIEEERKKVEDQLKWKKEQFNHLEQAHEKLRDQLRRKEKEWEKEKSTLVDEISTMQMNLDSHIRISKDLQSRLQMCNQALSHEESRRKYLEIQLSESKVCLDNIFAECDEVKSKLEYLTSQRDKEIASLRNLLGTKEAIYKEMEYKVRKLELENQELISSLKEVQEATIQESRPASVSKLRNKIKGLEQQHKDCSTNSKAKEAEWSSQLEKLARDLSDCRSELQSKDLLIKQLKKELKDCNSSTLKLTMKKYENSFELLVLKSEFLEAQSKLTDEMTGMCQKIKEKEDEISILMKQLEMKNRALVRAQTDNVESLDLIEQQKLILQKELDMHSRMLPKSSASELRLKEQLQHMESDLKTVCNALNRANDELAEKFCEVNEIEFELQIWRSVAERLKANLEENYQIRREVEASLLSQVEIEVTLKQEKEDLYRILEDKHTRIDELQRLLILQEQQFKARETESISLSRMEASRGHEPEKQSFIPYAKEKGKVSKDIERQRQWMKQDLVTKEAEGVIHAKAEAERIHKHEKKTLHQLVEEKDQRIENLQQLVKSLEKEFDRSTSSFSSQLAKMQTEICMFYEAWEKSKTTGLLKEMEIQEKILIIVELECDLSNLQQKLELEEKTLSGLRNRREEIETEKEAQQLEVEKLMQKLDTRQKSTDVLVKKLENENQILIEDVVKLTSDKEILMGTIEELYDKMCTSSSEDTQLMQILGRIVQNIESNEMAAELKGEDEVHNPAKENIHMHPSPMRTKHEVVFDERSPLRTLNK